MKSLRVSRAVTGATLLASLASLALLLAGCGGGGGTPAAPDTPPVVTPPVSMMDAFYKEVLAIVGMAPDDKEPADVTATAVTTPDNTEPEKVASP